MTDTQTQLPARGTEDEKEGAIVSMASVITLRRLGESDHNYVGRLKGYGLKAAQIEQIYPSYSLILEAERNEFLRGMPSD